VKKITALKATHARELAHEANIITFQQVFDKIEEVSRRGGYRTSVIVASEDVTVVEALRGLGYRAEVTTGNLTYDQKVAKMSEVEISW